VCWKSVIIWFTEICLGNDFVTLTLFSNVKLTSWNSAWDRKWIDKLSCLITLNLNRKKRHVMLILILTHHHQPTRNKDSMNVQPWSLCNCTHVYNIYIYKHAYASSVYQHSTKQKSPKSQSNLVPVNSSNPIFMFGC